MSAAQSRWVHGWPVLRRPRQAARPFAVLGWHNCVFLLLVVPHYCCPTAAAGEHPVWAAVQQGAVPGGTAGLRPGRWAGATAAAAAGCASLRQPGRQSPMLQMLPATNAIDCATHVVPLSACLPCRGHCGAASWQRDRAGRARHQPLRPVLACLQSSP